MSDTQRMAHRTSTIKKQLFFRYRNFCASTFDGHGQESTSLMGVFTVKTDLMPGSVWNFLTRSCAKGTAGDHN